MAAKYTANPGILATSIDAVDLAAAIGAGTEFALSIPSQGTPNISWMATFAGGNPASITVLLQASLDGTNWFTIDTSTSTTGEIRTISGSFRFLRLNNSAVTVGAGITLTASFVYSNSTRIDADTDLVLYSDSALNLPTTGTVQEVLKTVTIPANTFLSGYDGISVYAALRAAANVNQKSAALKIGGIAGDTICATTNDITSGNRFQYSCVATKDASNFNIQAISSRVTGSTFTFGTFTNVINFANPLDIVITATTPTSAGDVILTSMRVILLRRKL